MNLEQTIELWTQLYLHGKRKEGMDEQLMSLISHTISHLAAYKILRHTGKEINDEADG